MSIFSRIKLTKSSAAESKPEGKSESKGKEPASKVPYRHIPTHAAIDALSGAPSSWKSEDRPRIKEQHKRRSQMAVSRTTSYMSSTPSVGDSSATHRSTLHNGNGNLSPVLSSTLHTNSYSPANMPRSHSYSSINPTWNDRGDASVLHDSAIQKRKRTSRGYSYHEYAAVGPSPLSSSISGQAEEDETTSPPESSNSSSSSNHIEMSVSRPQATVYGNPGEDIFQRLHTSKTRKVGEAPVVSEIPQLSEETETPASVAKAAAEEKQKRKKARWSLRSSKIDAAIAA